ncbi:MAG: hypothetical protein J3K34DRAFT_428555 [Monoraphidium minutum]|nr:MAG: hypothetical protein J3K34DRAFT_428555 [Monoraphidium minutum]
MGGGLSGKGGAGFWPQQTGASNGGQRPQGAAPDRNVSAAGRRRGRGAEGGRCSSLTSSRQVCFCSALRIHKAGPFAAAPRRTPPLLAFAFLLCWQGRPAAAWAACIKAWAQEGAAAGQGAAGAPRGRGVLVGGWGPPPPRGWPPIRQAGGGSGRRRHGAAPASAAGRAPKQGAGGEVAAPFLWRLSPSFRGGGMAVAVAFGASKLRACSARLLLGRGSAH